MLTKGIPDLRAGEIKDEMDRGYYWYHMKHVPELDFLLRSKETVSIKESPERSTKDKLDIVLSLLKQKGYTPIAVDVSPPELKPYGMSVIKAVVPELHPFYLDENFKALKSTHAGTLPDLALPPHPFL